MTEVIDLFSKKRKKINEEEQTVKKDSFLSIAEKNAENEKRIKEERMKKNKNILRSYRIK